MRERHVLFTNLDYVTVDSVRTHTNALLLTDGPAMIGPGRRCELRGFGPDPAWPTFDRHVSSVEYEMFAADSSRTCVVIGDGDKRPRPLSTGAILRFAGGPEVRLIANDSDAPIDVVTIEGESDERPILRVWAVLPAKVRQYWRAPNMPRLAWGPR